MSRLIVKNLPKKITESKLEQLFSTKGVITDLNLKYTKDGVFRHFAFIGYKTEEEANATKEHFNNTFLNTSKIQVEICTDLADPNKPKSWKEKLSIKKHKEKDDSEKVETQKFIRKKIKNDIPEELKNDPQFKEFLDVNKTRKSKPVWKEDVGVNSSCSESEEEDEINSSDSDEISEHVKESFEDKLKLESASEIKEINVEQQKETPPTKIFNDVYTVKIKNLPYQCKKSQIKKFLHPSKISSLRLPPKSKGFAYVSFKTEKDMKQALNKNKGFLDGHCINVSKYIKRIDASDKCYSHGKVGENKAENIELLAETGRIFVRNLGYHVTEAEIEILFAKYGPIAELHVPIDFTTKKGKGFAFVLYVFAEHAVKAFTELDGTTFQGRLLHLIPAQPKKVFEIDENETNFKKKKEAERKKESGSSHNWNMLFLGMNAVADAYAEKLKIKKSELLSGNSSVSVAVRMAVAETEMVENTRKFLIENGVQLDAFSQPAAEQSKTVIVVTHLPAKTSYEELNDLFAKHGVVSRILLPPSGMVALVEYENPTEAKIAFTKLAYRRFKNLPLFLKWAPMDGLKDAPVKETKTEEEIKPEKESDENISTVESKDVPSTAGTTIYVKNINFNTTKEKFSKHFEQCGSLYQATISTKMDHKTGKPLSMGFGFVQFMTKDSAVFALQNLQHSILDGHALELKFANRSITSAPAVIRKKYTVKKQTSSKILVRNIPFQASEKEIKNLFEKHGMVGSVRLPKKLGEPGEHRGFGFVEFRTAEEAKRAFEALCHSTHLYNRRLVLEWANADSDSVSELRKKTAHRYSEDEPKKKVKKSKLQEDIVLAAARHTANDDDDDVEEE